MIRALAAHRRETGGVRPRGVFMLYRNTDAATYDQLSALDKIRCCKYTPAPPPPHPPPPPSLPPPSVKWVQAGDDVDGEGSYDQAGNSCALSPSGNVLAVGSAQNDGAGSNSGNVRVYRWNGMRLNWVQVSDDIDGATDQGLGVAVAIVDEPLTVAATDLKNRVHVYELSNETFPQVWKSRGSVFDGEEQYGAQFTSLGDGTFDADRTLAITQDAQIIAIGLPKRSDNKQGRVRVYRWVENDWKQIGQDLFGTSFADEFGHAVTLSYLGNVPRLAVGSPKENGFKGVVRAFEYSSDENTWKQLGDIISTLPNIALRFGTGARPEHFVSDPITQIQPSTRYVGMSVQFSSSGRRMVIGIPYLVSGNGRRILGMAGMSA